MEVAPNTILSHKGLAEEKPLLTSSRRSTGTATSDALYDFIGVLHQLSACAWNTARVYRERFISGIGHSAAGSLHFGPHGSAASIFDGLCSQRSIEDQNPKQTKHWPKKTRPQN
jgi:hypothetical protein